MHAKSGRNATLSCSEAPCEKAGRDLLRVLFLTRHGPTFCLEQRMTYLRTRRCRRSVPLCFLLEIDAKRDASPTRQPAIGPLQSSFFLRVFGVVGIVVYVGATCLAR